MPFEAADAGVPCLYAAVGALGELAGEEVAALVPWDAQASADAAAPLLGTGDARDRHVSALREAAANTSWAAAVPRLREIYAKAVASPHRASAPRTAEDADRESFIVGLAASAEHERVRSEHAHQRARELQDANAHGKRIIEETEAVLERLRADVARSPKSPMAARSAPPSGAACCAWRRDRRCDACCSRRLHCWARVGLERSEK